VQDLGTVMRGEDMRIDTYVEKSIDHELSSNIIDLCPVGALNNKPYRYSARSWEMIQHETIAAHDCVGSNLYAHVLRGKVKRIVPRENEAINETWISDRDRFSYEGIYSGDRLMSPMIKKDDKWQEISWKDALIEVVEKLKVVDQKSSAFLASPNSTLEEFYLLTKLSNDLSINNVDHRLRVVDFTDQDNDPKIPLLGMNIAEIEECKQIVVIGSDIRKEAPIIGHRIRKAALAGTQIGVINENINEYFFDISAYLSGSMIENLLGLLNVLGGESPKEMQDISKQIKPTEKHKEMAAILNSEGKGHLILGHLAINHSYASVIRTLSAKIAHLTGSELGFVTEGSNAAGAHLMGMLPHRGFAGVSQDIVGKNVQEMTENSLDLLLLFNAEPGNDLPSFSFEKAGHSFVIAMTPYATEKYKMTADIMLPIGTFAETSGTYINCENRSQSFAGIANPVGESRPGWKVLCAIGSMLGMSDFELESSESVLDEISQKLNDMPTSNIKPNYSTQNITNSKNFLDSNLVQRTPMYEVDSVLRHAASLQLTPEACRSGKT
jgi:NADH-quinone oxidoreductase subunit G